MKKKLLKLFPPDDEKIWWKDLSTFGICRGYINVLNQALFDGVGYIILFYLNRLLDF